MPRTQNTTIATQLAVVILLAINTDAKSGYEEPLFDVVEQFDEFEIRRYAPYLVAETTVAGDFDDSGNAAFRRLAGYIFGDNQARTKMKMTIPVTREPTPSEKMQMTAPVTRRPSSEEGRAAYTYQFVMERKYALETLPVPNDDRVTLREVPQRLVAVRRYSGTTRERNFSRNLAILKAALAAAGLTTVGEAQSATYNGPFTLPFLRRNEVLIELAPSSANQ